MLSSIPDGMQSLTPTGALAGTDPLLPTLDHHPAQGCRWCPAGRDVQTPQNHKSLDRTPYSTSLSQAGALSAGKPP